jgi:chromosome partitioning protein
MTTVQLSDLRTLRNVLEGFDQRSSRSNVLVICNGKGGVGKSTLASHLAAGWAYSGERVLLVEMDPQANTAEDLGFTADTSINDQGKRQAEAVMNSLPLEPSGEVRPRLFVAPGGSQLEDVVTEELYCQRRAARITGDGAWMYMYAASVRSVAHQFDWVILDVAPGSAVLQAQAMVAGDWVIVPTRSDVSSRKGLRTVTSRIRESMPYNPDLTFLGIVLFAIGSSASRVEKRIREALESDVQGSAPVFDTAIRYVEAAAQACRTHGLVARELEHAVRPGDSDGPGVHVGPSLDASVRRSAAGLARDYRSLAFEILARIGALKAEAANGQE